jgi:hypothetical protein
MDGPSRTLPVCTGIWCTRAAGQRPYELEISVDETEQPPSHAEHLYFASELRRLGVSWVSLAPRFIGKVQSSRFIENRYNHRH